jgi:EAL domain-containing protein (putative c-di-GMP-specific phosphodiesterase class I)
MKYELESDLRFAIERAELEVLYQPIVRADDGTVQEAEALLRWNHPRRGLVMPGEFIPVAEETGLIIPIGAWVLREACRQTKAWHDKCGASKSLVVAVNISGRQFSRPGLADLVAPRDRAAR